jgi:DNA-binding transcriptional ArsR family regulator
VHVLDADPDLGALLRDQRLIAARRRLVAREHAVPRGEWIDDRLHRAGPEHLGLLVLDGVVARELLLSDNVSTELLGAGDLLRPWQDRAPAQLLRARVRWTVLEPVRCAVLDQAFAEQVAHFSEVHTMLIDRVTERAHRLAVTQAISQLNGVDHRIHALLWHLAERWGRVTSRGPAISLNLPHRILAQLVGARRPTVSTALRELVDAGLIERRPDGGWLLTGEPVGMPTLATRRFVSTRRPRRGGISDQPAQIA